MFKIIDLLGTIWPCYGTFIDDAGNVQFIIEFSDGSLGKTNSIPGIYKIYHGDEEIR